MAGTSDLTLMAVHAHPDDEAIGTGGTLARYSAEGVRTVLVTCTNGEQGDAAGGTKPGEAAHSPADVAALRLSELQRSVETLGVSQLEMLGYRDSGMAGWSANSDPGVFCNVPLGEASERIAALMLEYRPQVVLTYDENGGYGHPDHIQAHRATIAAAEQTGVPAKVYYGTIPRSGFQRLREMIEGSDIDIEMPELPEDFGTPDEEITAIIDVSRYVDQKRQSLAAHASQIENFFLQRLPEDVLSLVLSQEFFVLRGAPPGQIQEEDLFTGLR